MAQPSRPETGADKPAGLAEQPRTEVTYIEAVWLLIEHGHHGPGQIGRRNAKRSRWKSCSLEELLGGLSKHPVCLPLATPHTQIHIHLGSPQLTHT